jgi:HPr kinase/phosphorylase
MLSGHGVLFMGPSGSGKSDLTLRLIDGGAMLVGDDQIQLFNTGNCLLASPVVSLAGMIEIRGIGIKTLPYESNAPVSLAVSLVDRDKIERMPEPQFFDCLGHQVPLLYLHAFDNSTPAKITMALRFL